MTATDPAAMRRVELTRRLELLDASGAPIPASERWSRLLAEDAQVVRKLVEQGLAFARQHAPEWLRKAATWLAVQGWSASSTGGMSPRSPPSPRGSASRSTTWR